MFLWDKNLNDCGLVNTWSSEVKDIFHRNGLDYIYDQPIFPLKSITSELKTSLLRKDQINWQSQCRTLPKLRTFIQFKNFETDSPHIFKPLSFMQRKLMSKFRLGLLRLRLETGRYIRPRMAPEDRVCLICNNGQVEDEIHFLLFCDKYDEIRRKLFDYVHDNENFQGLGNIDKLQLLLNDPKLVKQTAIFITEAYEYRSTII